MQHHKFAGGGLTGGVDGSAGAARKRSGSLAGFKDPGMSPPASSKSSGKPAAAPRRRIAVVEDLPETRKSLVRLLQSFPEFDCV